MPSFVPREKPIRKQEQLLQREMELITALRKNFTGEKLFKFVDKYRHSQLAIRKANIHYIKELEYQKKLTTLNKEKIEAEISVWTAKTNEEIIEEITTKFIKPKY
jgi:hypothetical protein